MGLGLGWIGGDGLGWIGADWQVEADWQRIGALDWWALARIGGWPGWGWVLDW